MALRLTGAFMDNPRVRPDYVTWYTRTRELGTAAKIGLAQDPPLGITLNWLKDGRTLDGMPAKSKV